jgi:host factor-I protein
MSRNSKATNLANANQLQNAFLGAARGGNMTLYLVNGVRLQGALALEDRHTLLLVRGNVAHLVYKHAIATALPAEPIEVGPSDTTD